MKVLTTIKGTDVLEDQVLAALAVMPASGFSKPDFSAALVQHGLPEAHDLDFTRRLMQHLKNAQVLNCDGQLWTIAPVGTATASAPTPTAPATQTLSHQAPSVSWGEQLFVGVGWIVSIAMITALVSLNASFALDLGQEAWTRQASLLIGLAALDLLRPLLMAAGVTFWARAKYLSSVLSFVIALCLAPLSVLSTTTVLSTSLQLGAEKRAVHSGRVETLSELRAEYARRSEAASQALASMQYECARGGCGPKAAMHEETYLREQNAADRLFRQILEREEIPSSDRLARVVETFHALGIFTNERQILLPLLIAMAMELGALFGPALLLHARR